MTDLTVTSSDLEPRYIKPAGAEFPVMQMLAAHDGGAPEVTATFQVGDRLSFFTGTIIEASRIRAISMGEIERLAEILGTEVTVRFVFDVYDTAIGYAALVVHGFFSPRTLRNLLHDLELNPEATIEKYRDIPFASLLFARVEKEAGLAMTSPYDDHGRRFRQVARRVRDDLRQLIPRGRGNDHPEALFLHHVVKMARRLGCDLKLPARDPSRGDPTATPLFDFADTMRALLIEQGRAFGASPTDIRFGRVARMTVVGLVIALERAKATVAAENAERSGSPR
jgi:hypothetical protein